MLGGVTVAMGTGLCSAPLPVVIVGITMKMDAMFGVPTVLKVDAVNTAGAE